MQGSIPDVEGEVQHATDAVVRSGHERLGASHLPRESWPVLVSLGDTAVLLGPPVIRTLSFYQEARAAVPGYREAGCVAGQHGNDSSGSRREVFAGTGS